MRSSAATVGRTQARSCLPNTITSRKNGLSFVSTWGITMEYQDNKGSIVSLSADIVSAYVSKNPVPVSELSSLIASIHRSLLALGAEQEPATAEPQKPAVPVKKSVSDDFIICLEDGKKFKSMRRHIGVHYGLTPDAYREKWGLPANYPMVAPRYAAERSALAKKTGLGRIAQVPAPAPEKRGRKKATT
jgi:predicted transcriptional regulator